MEIGRITGCTHVIGKSQGYLGLPIRAEMLNCIVNGANTPAMTTAWFPSPEEIAAIVAGAPIHVRILGTQHPPIMLMTGEVPKDGD